MKLASSIIFLVFIYVGTISAQKYGLGNTDPSVFTKYKVPETKLSSLFFGTDFGYNSSSSELIAPSQPQNDYSQYQLNVRLAPKYYYLDENDDKTFSINSEIAGEYGKDNSKRNGQVQRDRESNMLRFTGDVLYRKYFGDEKIFYSISANTMVIMDEVYTDNPAQSNNTSYVGSKNQNYNVAFGVGWGKLRNITSVVSAIRLQERLKQLSIINDNLNVDAVNEIAGQYSRYSNYADVHVRPEKYFWYDMEKVLEKNGIALSGINQFGSSYLREINNEIRFIRNEGFVAGINLGLDYTNYYSSNSPSVNKIDERLNLITNLYADFSTQLNLYSQLRFSLSFSGGPNLIKDVVTRQEYTMNAGIGYDYELTDMLVLSVSDFLNYLIRNADENSKQVINNFNVSANYFLEDKIVLALSYNWRHQYFNDGIFKYYIHNNQIALGLTYYLDRGMLIK